MNLFNLPNDKSINLQSTNKAARLERQIYLRFHDMKKQDLLFGQRRICLVYENKMKIYCRWFLTENIFWIMTCIGLSWLFRVIFACLITKIIVPIHIELEGAMPLKSTMITNETNLIKEKVFSKV